jgi:hypothetical protein
MLIRDGLAQLTQLIKYTKGQITKEEKLLAGFISLLLNKRGFKVCIKH